MSACSTLIKRLNYKLLLLLISAFYLKLQLSLILQHEVSLGALSSSSQHFAFKDDIHTTNNNNAASRRVQIKPRILLSHNTFDVTYVKHDNRFISNASLNHHQNNNDLVTINNNNIVFKNKNDDDRDGADNECVKLNLPPRYTCNILHEIDLSLLIIFSQASIVGNGGWRSVLQLDDIITTPFIPSSSSQYSYHSQNSRRRRSSHKSKIILKVLRIDKDFTPYTYERNNIDSVITELFSKSSSEEEEELSYSIVTNSYGFCGQSILTEYADGNLRDLVLHYDQFMRENNLLTDSSGTVDDDDDDVKHSISIAMKIDLTRQLVKLIETFHGVTLHNIANIAHSEDVYGDFINITTTSTTTTIDIADEQVVMTHHDLKPENILYRIIENNNNNNAPKKLVLKLNDFNDSHLSLYNITTTKSCTFTRRQRVNPWVRYRAPEQAVEGPSSPNLTHKLDIFSIGAIIYFLVTDGKKPYHEKYQRDAIEAVIRGEMPKVPEIFTNELLIKVMEMCFQYNPGQRASASKILEFMNNNSM